MTIQNREAFLQKIAGSLGREPRLDGVSRPDWQYEPQKTVYQGLTSDQLVSILEEHCRKIHTRFLTTTSSRLNETLFSELFGCQASKIVTTGDPRFHQYGLYSYLRGEQAKGRWEVHEWNPDIPEGNVEAAQHADVGITFSDITLAESATVVLFSEGGKGTLVSLLPTIYIAIIPQSTIVPRFTQAAQEIHRRIANGEGIPSCINFISGPSNSADIEMDLVVGVHGPIQATYIVVTDDPTNGS